MAKSFPLPMSCILRPAVAEDKWQVHGLMGYFNRVSPSPFSPLLRILGYVFLGLMIIFFIQLAWVAGIQSLYYPIGFIVIVYSFKYLSIALSKEWQKFWVLEADRRIIGCAKLCQYMGYSVLYNVLIHPQFRRQGLGSALVYRMTEEAGRPLYLACLSDKIAFYRRLGFVELRPHEVPPLIRYDLGLVTQPQVVPMVLR